MGKVECAAYALATRYDTSQLARLAQELDAAFLELGKHANNSVLYAPRRTVQRFDALMKELMAIAVTALNAVQRGQLYEEFAKRVDSMVASLDQITFDLAQEIRGELGIERIELAEVEKGSGGL